MHDSGVMEEARTLFEDGLGMTEISRRLGIAIRTLYNWKKGWETKDTGEPVEEVQVTPPESEEEIGEGVDDLPSEGLDTEEEKPPILQANFPVPSWIHFRGPRDRQQYEECLAEAGGDYERVARRGLAPDTAPWIVLPPPLVPKFLHNVAPFRSIYYHPGKEFDLKREEGRRRRIKKLLTPEYLAEVQRLKEKEKEAVAYDVV